MTEVKVREAWREIFEGATAGLVKRSTAVTVTELLVDGMEAMATSKARVVAPLSGMLPLLSSSILEIVQRRANGLCGSDGDVAE